MGKDAEIREDPSRRRDGNGGSPEARDSGVPEPAARRHFCKIEDKKDDMDIEDIGPRGCRGDDVKHGRGGSADEACATIPVPDGQAFDLAEGESGTTAIDECGDGTSTEMHPRVPEHRGLESCAIDAKNDGAFMVVDSEQKCHEKGDAVETPVVIVESVLGSGQAVALNRDSDGQESSGDAEVLWTERPEADLHSIHGGGGVKGTEGVLQNTVDNPHQKGVVGGNGVSGKAPRGSLEMVGDDRSGNIPEGLGGEHERTQEWRPRKGDLVEVERRMTPGVNKPGGTARVVKVDSATDVVDVRYVVEGGWERGIDPVYVRPAVLNLSEKRSTLGRCRHCGSLRVDCGQGCEFYTAPPSTRPRPPPPLSPSLAILAASPSSGVAITGSDPSRDGGEMEGRQRGRGKRRHSSQLSGGGRSGRGRRDDLRRRRRHLPDDWDEEGEPVPGSEDVGTGESDSETPVRGGWRRRGGRRWTETDSDRSSSLRARGRHSSGDSSSSCSGDSGSGGGGGGSAVDDDGMDESDGSRPRRGLGVTRFDREGGSDSDVELLGGRRGRHSSSSDKRGANDSRHDSGGKASRSPDHGVGRSGWRGSAGDADRGGTGLFLMPEGEEAAQMLPSDIPDPTRGVTDPVVLRKELKRLLQEMEGRDVNELEQDVAALCR